MWLKGGSWKVNVTVCAGEKHWVHIKATRCRNWSFVRFGALPQLLSATPQLKNTNSRSVTICHLVIFRWNSLIDLRPTNNFQQTSNILWQAEKWQFYGHFLFAGAVISLVDAINLIFYEWLIGHRVMLTFYIFSESESELEVLHLSPNRANFCVTAASKDSNITKKTIKIQCCHHFLCIGQISGGFFWGNVNWYIILW